MVLLAVLPIVPMVAISCLALLIVLRDPPSNLTTANFWPFTQYTQKVNRKLIRGRVINNNTHIDKPESSAQGAARNARLRKRQFAANV